MLMQPNILYLNPQIGFIKLFYKYLIYKDFIFSLRVRNCVVFEAVELHNRRRGDRGAFQTQISLQVKEKKQGEKETS